MIDIDKRPRVEKFMLMFVRGIDGERLFLTEVGDSTTRAEIDTRLPFDALRHLIGRHVIVNPNWGGKLEIVRFLPVADPNAEGE